MIQLQSLRATRRWIYRYSSQLFDPAILIIGLVISCYIQIFAVLHSVFAFVSLQQVDQSIDMFQYLQYCQRAQCGANLDENEPFPHVRSRARHGRPHKHRAPEGSPAPSE